MTRGVLPPTTDGQSHGEGPLPTASQLEANGKHASATKVGVRGRDLRADGPKGQGHSVTGHLRRTDATLPPLAT